MRDMITPKTPIMNYSELNALSIEELSMLNKKLIEVIKMKRTQAANEAKYWLKVGNEVKVNHPKLMGKKLVVNEIRRTKVSVDLFNDLGHLCGRYSVPISLVEIC